ncbi:dihydrolipoyl dehydrogenase family protein [Nonomuraea gerenzanensis]|uniref:PF00070 family, FAD-dependent NAD(P)-disulphide oxidoreductase n=1 Tax=Nonomuraea gerenzanensis TaxID=93944 RepID=A0A1M4E1C3_9ACTN|nr:NAD(P)/FAD-dependent oxidoreductase [Nonomuraea gerenzanensis]UBU14892.1 NAD(P)/FAD-dependent oxidoreductase [Nonomuraea gerenzanensis]SBO92627.1 PF00070 family, FAD-dependent NAD(P)-disulphide oxidoreductase [Nonomuraea gerenzanensis]
MTIEDTRTYDVVVIGAGPVGENVADRTAAAGLSTVIVESELVGGECSYWACEPSKALLRPALLRAEAGRVPGLAAGALDTAAVLAHRDRMSADWNDEGQVEWLKSAGIELQRGHGRLDGPRCVAVTTPGGDTVRLLARHAVAVCTGSGAALPDLPWIAGLRPWTSREATSARRPPGRLVIVGAGVVATEMATAWQALGSSVTLLVRGGGLLPRMEPFAGELVAQRLREAGVDLRFGVTVATAARTGGEVHLILSDGDRLGADEILFATGRAPRTGDLGLESVGLPPGDWLTTDDTYTVTAAPGGWLYAAGDVNQRALFTHQGKYQARIAGAVIAARAAGAPVDTGPWSAHAGTADTAAVPAVVFSDPEVASVGLTTMEAAHTGRRVDVVDYDLGHVAGALQHDPGYQGRARALIDPERRTVVGVTFAGPGVAELLHSATVAIVGEIPIERLWHAVPAFPTISEVWLRLLEAYRDR